MASIRCIFITALVLLDASLAVRQKLEVAHAEIQPRGMPLVNTWVDGLHTHVDNGADWSGASRDFHNSSSYTPDADIGKGKGRGSSFNLNADAVPYIPQLTAITSLYGRSPESPEGYKPHSVPKKEVFSTPPERLQNNFMGEFDIDKAPSEPLEGHTIVTSIQPFLDGKFRGTSTARPRAVVNNFGMPQVSSGAQQSKTTSEVQAFRDVPDKMFNKFFRVMHNRLAPKSGGSITMEQFREYCARENGPAVAWLEANGLDGVASPRRLLWLIDQFNGPTEAYTSKAWVETMMRLVHSAQQDSKHMPTLPIEDVTDLSGASAMSIRAVSIVLETPIFSDIWPVRCDGQSANGIAISGLDTSGFACDPTGLFIDSPPILRPTAWAQRDIRRSNGLQGDEYFCKGMDCLKLEPESHHVYLPFSRAAQRVFSQSQALSTVIPSSQKPTVKTAVTTDAGAKVPVIIKAVNSRGVVAIVAMRMLHTDLEFEPTTSRLTPFGLQFLKELVDPMGALVLRQIAAYKIEAKRSVKVLFCAHGSTTANAENIDPEFRGLPLDRARTVIDHLQLAKPKGESVYVDDEGIGHYDEEVKDFHGGRYGYIIYKVFDASLKSVPKCQREDLHCFLPKLRNRVKCT